MPKEVIGYAETVGEQRDLSLVEIKLTHWEYRTVNEFLNDLKLVWGNIKTFYKPKSFFWRQADIIEMFVNHLVKNEGIFERFDMEKEITEEDKKTEKEQEEYKSKGNDKKQNGQYLDDEEQDKVDQMKARDEEVRVHENAHKSAGGSYAGAPQYEYEKGPDGKSYVTDGHVNIDIGKESTPEKTVEKMKVVINAANAPAEPSSQDRKVASQARQQLNEAQQELSKEKLNSSNKAEDKTAPTADATSSQAPTL